MPEKIKATRELKALYRVSQAIGASLDLRRVVEDILSILAEELGMQRGTLALLDPETGELAIEAAHGLTESEKRRGRYRVGEGIMGRVLETGEPMIIPNIGAEPLFLNRTGARRDIDRSQVAFLCVPVKAGSETVGVLSADQVSEPAQDLEEDLRLLTIVAGVVAQAVRIRLMVATEKAELAEENRHLRQALEGTYRLENLVGASSAMEAVYEQVRLVARSRAPVLITGEPGTGKEHLAKAIHFNSDRAAGPFLRLTCANAPEEMLEPELFGAAAPAGGRGQKPGRILLADGGTLFLDEVGELPARLQGRLLEALQTAVVSRPARGEPRRVDVRVVASTARDLAREVRQGRFREDLYHRLNGVPIHLPPLRERKGDIPLLAHHFAVRFAQESGKGIEGLAPEALAELGRYDWPGNVRELESVVERAVLTCRGRVIEAADLPVSVLGPPGRLSGGAEPLEVSVVQEAERLFGDPPPEGVYRALVDRVERVLVERAVHRCGGVRLKAARLLGINRNTLYAKLRGDGGS